MDMLTAILLGVVQGLTEFLPVSSSGHQVLAQRLLDVDLSAKDTLVFTVLVHVASAVAIIVFLVQEHRHWRSVLFHHVAPATPGAGETTQRFSWRATIRWVVFLVLATVPAAVVGLTLNDLIEESFSSTLLVGCALCVTAVVLLLGERLARRHAAATSKTDTNDEDGDNDDPPADHGPGRLLHETAVASRGGLGVLLIGIAQAIAIVPGISRSGFTIATGLAVGMRRDETVRFSFLLALAAILGGAVLKARELGELSATIGTAPLVAGFLASLVSSYLALRVMMALVRRRQLGWFALYCFAVGLLAITADLAAL